MGIKIKAKCHQCGIRNVLDIEPAMTSGKIKNLFVCQNCGAMNELDIDPQNLGDTEQDWLCESPKGFEWILPSGKVTPIVGDPIYISSLGEQLSRKVYLERYKVDPEIAYQFMHRKKDTQTAKVITNKPSPTTTEHSAADLWIDKKKSSLQRLWRNYI
jgi:hypothetical protein